MLAGNGDPCVQTDSHGSDRLALKEVELAVAQQVHEALPSMQEGADT